LGDFSFLREGVEGGDKRQANLLQGEQMRKKYENMETWTILEGNEGTSQGI